MHDTPLFVIVSMGGLTLIVVVLGGIAWLLNRLAQIVGSQSITAGLLQEWSDAAQDEKQRREDKNQ